jgi:hypothetical protein
VQIAAPVLFAERSGEMTSLPQWLQWAQAIALVCIPLIGALLAWQQVRVAYAKLQLDLYDRRFAVFDAARRLLLEVARERTASPEGLVAFIVATADANFLFNDEINTYLVELRKRVEHLQVRTKAMDAMPLGDQRTAMFHQTNSEFLELNRELDGLVDRFRRFLRLDRL